jgi:hypothetical protein
MFIFRGLFVGYIAILLAQFVGAITFTSGSTLQYPPYVMLVFALLVGGVIDILINTLSR